MAIEWKEKKGVQNSYDLEFCRQEGIVSLDLNLYKSIRNEWRVSSKRLSFGPKKLADGKIPLENAKRLAEEMVLKHCEDLARQYQSLHDDFERVKNEREPQLDEEEIGGR